MNRNRNKQNQLPTGEGKKQSHELGSANKLNKRAEVLQASSAEQKHWHPSGGRGFNSTLEQSKAAESGALTKIDD